MSMRKKLLTMQKHFHVEKPQSACCYVFQQVLRFQINGKDYRCFSQVFHTAVSSANCSFPILFVYQKRKFLLTFCYFYRILCFSTQTRKFRRGIYVNIFVSIEYMERSFLASALECQVSLKNSQSSRFQLCTKPITYSFLPQLSQQCYCWGRAERLYLTILLFFDNATWERDHYDCFFFAICDILSSFEACKKQSEASYLDARSGRKLLGQCMIIAALSAKFAHKNNNI